MSGILQKRLNNGSRENYASYILADIIEHEIHEAFVIGIHDKTKNKTKIHPHQSTQHQKKH
mgnify:CR=1 FL=1